MQNRCIGIVLAASAAACGANGAAPAIARAPKETREALAAERVAGEVLLRADTTRIVRELADRIGPRLTGTEACDRAEAWVATEMERAGLRVQRERYALASWSPGLTRLALVAPSAAELTAVPVGWTGSTPPEGVEGPLKLVDAAAIDTADVSGAIVVVKAPQVVDRAWWALTRDQRSSPGSSRAG